MPASLLLLLAIFIAQVVSKRQGNNIHFDSENFKCLFAQKLCNNERTCNCACGRRAFIPEPALHSGFEERIVGGDEARPHSHPWLVRLNVRGHLDETDCGGTLLNHEFVLTAAHCVKNLEPQQRKDLVVIFGDHEQEDFSKERQQLRKVKKIHAHNWYDSTNHDNDIALLELKRPVQYNDFIQPACVPSFDVDKNYPEVTMALVVGWGQSSLLDSTQPDPLHEVEIPLLTRHACNGRTLMYTQTRITNNMICGGSEGKDACQGDSGGPLLVQRDGRVEVHGIVSSGIGCGQEGYPGVYTKVHNYLRWIKKRMKIKRCINCY